MPYSEAEMLDYPRAEDYAGAGAEERMRKAVNEWRRRHGHPYDKKLLGEDASPSSRKKDYSSFPTDFSEGIVSSYGPPRASSYEDDTPFGAKSHRDGFERDFSGETDRKKLRDFVATCLGISPDAFSDEEDVYSARSKHEILGKMAAFAGVAGLDGIMEEKLKLAYEGIETFKRARQTLSIYTKDSSR